MIVEWLVSQPTRFRGSPEFCRALRLFADGTSTLHVAADHIRVEWFPPGSYIIEQDEPATELFCIMSGTAEVVREHDDGSLHRVDTTVLGDFVGEEGLASGKPRNAHVIARDAVTCLVLAAEKPSQSAGRGEGAIVRPTEPAQSAAHIDVTPGRGVEVDVRPALHHKVAALAAHRSQYAFEPDLLPCSMLERLLGREYFVVADV
jgi:CRP-like cAMP-binding protein